MEVFVGVDAAKDVHWACAVDRDARALFSRAVANDPDGIAGLLAEIAALQAGRVRVALDLLGGSATRLCAMLTDAGLAVVHTPGLAVNRARQGMRGGENKSGPRDAATIAELARTRPDLRPDLRPVAVETGIDVDIRLLVGRRREIVVDQTRRLSRLRDLVSSLFPALERRVDVTIKAGLVFLGLFAAPRELRRASPARMARQLAKAARDLRGVDALARAAVELARAQTVDVPGAEPRARLVKDLAAEALRARETRIQIDADLAALLARHPDAALIQSLPGMGVVLTAEFVACAGNRARFHSADALAAAAGLTPVLRRSGKSRAIRRSTSGDRPLKRVFFQSAFVALSHPESRAFYDRKRAGGKRRNQAVIALARRRVNVLWAILNSRQPHRENTRSLTGALGCLHARALQDQVDEVIGRDRADETDRGFGVGGEDAWRDRLLHRRREARLCVGGQQALGAQHLDILLRGAQHVVGAERADARRKLALCFRAPAVEPLGHAPPEFDPLEMGAGAAAAQSIAFGRELGPFGQQRRERRLPREPDSQPDLDLAFDPRELGVDVCGMLGDHGLDIGHVGRDQTEAHRQNGGGRHRRLEHPGMGEHAPPRLKDLAAFVGACDHRAAAETEERGPFAAEAVDALEGGGEVRVGVGGKAV